MPAIRGSCEFCGSEAKAVFGFGEAAPKMIVCPRCVHKDDRKRCAGRLSFPLEESGALSIADHADRGALTITEIKKAISGPPPTPIPSAGRPKKC